MLPENQYIDNRDCIAKDSNISIYESFEVLPERQSIDDQFAFFLNKFLGKHPIKVKPHRNIKKSILKDSISDRYHKNVFRTIITNIYFRMVLKMLEYKDLGRNGLLLISTCLRACLKTLLPENQYLENRDGIAKDSNISIYGLFKESPKLQDVDFLFALFLNKF